MSGVTTDATTVQLVEPPAAATTPTRPKPLRLSFCHNGGQRKGQPQSTALVVPIADQVLATAANKLKLKKKDVARARVFASSVGARACALLGRTQTSAAAPGAVLHNWRGLPGRETASWSTTLRMSSWSMSAAGSARPVALR